MRYLSYDDLLHVAARTFGTVEIRDAGLLRSALYRPVAGVDAYPTLALQAAALLHSIARNRGLVDGNKRLALAATVVFLGLNGRRLVLSNDDAYDVVMVVAAGEVDDVHRIAAALESGSEDWA